MDAPGLRPAPARPSSPPEVSDANDLDDTAGGPEAGPGNASGGPADCCPPGG
ncbi:hypothetical protein [Kitasatospora griseola]|uniref:hypothetical protein n=1 Tax=Kitasatospora griseola TaxID=2064 RepID=UPI00382B8FE9